MAILNYTTEIKVETSMGEVIGALTRRGVTRIATVFDDNGVPAGIAFTMKTDYGLREFDLPVRTEGVLKVLTEQRKTNTRVKATPEQAARIAWRIAKDWLEAQSALIDAELASLDEVMLPYMVGKGGKTVYSVIREDGMKAIAGGQS
jgi:hypothetical protein